MARTRRRIVDAVVAITSSDHPAALTVPAVSELAGVSVRTVYRHFPTKEALLDSLQEIGGRAVTELALARHVALDELGALLRQTWNALVPLEPTLRAQHLTPAGREARARRIAWRRVQLSETIAPALAGLDPVSADRLLGLVETLVSSATLFELTAQGLDADQAADTAMWAVHAALDRAVADGHVGSGTATAPSPDRPRTDPSRHDGGAPPPAERNP